jgi:hypothetical protein
VEWLRGLGNESIDCYLWLMEPLNRETLGLSKALRIIAREDSEVKLLESVPGIGYYIA